MSALIDIVGDFGPAKPTQLALTPTESIAADERLARERGVPLVGTCS